MPPDVDPKKKPSQKPDLTPALGRLPARPGCYVFRDSAGAVLYVGKAKSLRSRVRSYFQEGSSDGRAFIPLLRAQVAAFETFVTQTEKEAAILENSLIKESQPRFNVKLRDDKEFLTLRLDTRKAWPRLELARRPGDDRARYFGPYHSATAARRTLHVVEKHFQLRTCTDRDLKSRTRPCLQYQIQRCLAPCVYEVDERHYAQQVRAVALFLDGRHAELTRDLKQRMADASANLEFERAAVYRNQLAAVSSAHETQNIESVTRRDRDVLGLFRERPDGRDGPLVELAVLSSRQGRIIEAATYSLSGVRADDEEVVAAFLRQFYAAGRRIPDEVVVAVLPDASEGVAESLSEVRAAQPGRGKKCRIFVPVRGDARRLLELATENAKHAYEQKQRAAEDMDAQLAALQAKLRLPTVPRVIECCDISHHGGRDTVGSVVCFRDGVPNKKRYRSYNIRTVDGGDDYGAMYEVLSRRFRRGRDAESGDDWELPDLFLVDGGRGQLGVAVTAARDLGLHDLSLAGLAKERENTAGDQLTDRVYLPGQKNPIAVKPGRSGLHILARARDEAHRFANRARKRAGGLRTLKSELDDVRGIGPKTRAALLSTLGSFRAVLGATDEQLLSVEGVTQRHVKALRAHVASTREE